MRDKNEYLPVPAIGIAQQSRIMQLEEIEKAERERGASPRMDSGNALGGVDEF